MLRKVTFFIVITYKKYEKFSKQCNENEKYMRKIKAKRLKYNFFLYIIINTK